MDPSQALTSILQPQVQVKPWVISPAVSASAEGTTASDRVKAIKNMDGIFFLDRKFILSPPVYRWT
jgi:hypothetical protein